MSDRSSPQRTLLGRFKNGWTDERSRMNIGRLGLTR